MTPLKRLFPLLALLAFGCKAKPPAHRMGTSVNIAPTGVFQVIPATMDPNAANLPGAVGTRVQNAGGANAWDKGTDGLWHVVTGSSGGGVPDGGLAVSVADGGGVLGNGTVANPLTAATQFGPNTIVSLNNTASTPVSALQLINTLTTTTAGSEASKWVIKVLVAGGQVTAVDIRPAQVLLPYGGSGAPAFSFQDTDSTGHGPASGMYFDNAGNRVVIQAGGGGTFWDASGPNIVSALGSVRFNGGSDALRRISPNGDMQITLTHDFVIGAASALATSATAGFVQVPVCAGAPTGAAGLNTGKAAVVVDSTDNKLCWSSTSGTWKCVTGT